MKSPFRTCEFCKFFYNGRNKIDYCLERKKKVKDPEMEFPYYEKTIGDTCAKFIPSSPKAKELIEAAEAAAGITEDDDESEI